MTHWRFPLAAAALAVAVVTMVAGGAALAANQHYVNERFGTSATFPRDKFPDQLPAPTDGDGLGWSAPDGANIFIYARRNTGGETPSSVIAGRRAEDGVTYKAQGKRWAVVSGYREGNIFYERYIFRGDLIHSVSIRYSRSDRATYDRLVGPVTLTLRGPSRD